MKKNIKPSNISLNSELITNLSEINDLQSSRISGGVNKFFAFTPAIIYDESGD